MTVQSVITLMDTIRPNIVSEESKLHWIYTLEKKISEHMSRFGECTVVEPVVSPDSSLLLEKEYQYMYAYYGVSMIDLGNQDIAMYNNSSTYFNDMFESWQKKWRREHLPLSGLRGDK